MLVVMLVVGIFLLVQQAEPYKLYTKIYAVSYVDTMGLLGGFLFGVPLTWVFVKPYSGTLKAASRREICLFITGIIWSVGLLIAMAVVFATSSSEHHWYIE